MKVLMYSTRSYDKISFRKELGNYSNIEIKFTESQLNLTTVEMAKGFDAICIFVNDHCTTEVVAKLHEFGVKKILCRCVGTNNVDVNEAVHRGLGVYNVPAYSPESVAEHALALLMTVNRHTHKAYNRVRDNNFSLTGLSGYCLYGKTVGIIGYGKIGKAFAHICRGLGMRVIGYDPMIKSDMSFTIVDDVFFYSTPEGVFANADVISLHVPLLDSTKHMINKETISKMKDGVILINVSRGGLIDTEALIEANKKGKFFGIGLDVYEGEDDNVFTNHEDDILMNCITSRLTSFPNVVVTSHQAFLTDVALEQIAKKTLDNCIGKQ